MDQASMPISRRHFMTTAGLALPLSHTLAPAAALAQATNPPGTPLGTPARAPASTVPDWDVPNGHFFTQTAGADAPADSGFLVSNADGVSFWRDYKEMGGPAVLGYPISGRFERDGKHFQATQAALLYWDAPASRTSIYPLFRALAEMEMDGWLEAIGIPAAAPELAEELMGESSVPLADRHEWLTHPSLRGAYWAAYELEGPRRFGLPMSEPQRFGPYLAQRFERAVLQLWLDDLPNMPASGTISMVQIGDLLDETELLPAGARLLQAPPAPRPVLTTVTPAIAGPAPASPIDGKHLILSLSRQWWYAYEGGALEYSGPVTTGRPELVTPLGRFRILSKHTPYTFVSPWGRGSPFWYETATSSYALRITDNGIFFHDAPWRPYNGPGTNVPHTDPDGVWRTGSHGCINMPLAAAAWAYRWAPLGMPVDVII